MQNKYPPRPAWNHAEVKTLAAAEFVDEVQAWAELMGVVEVDEHDPKEFLALLTLALRESPDAYQAGRYLEDFIGWPVTGDLIRVLDRAYSRMPHLAKECVHTWVTENGVRFPAKKGEGVRFRIGDFEGTGKVIEVIAREATAYVVPTGKDRPLPVNAEEVLQVVHLKKR